MERMCMALTNTVRSVLRELEANGCKCKFDQSLGIATAFDTESQQEVYRAIQKGRGAPWIVRLTPSVRIQFTKET